MIEPVSVSVSDCIGDRAATLNELVKALRWQHHARRVPGHAKRSGLREARLQKSVNLGAGVPSRRALLLTDIMSKADIGPDAALPNAATLTPQLGVDGERGGASRIFAARDEIGR